MHPGGRISHGSGILRRSGKSSTGSGDLSLVLETLFWLSAKVVKLVTRKTLVLGMVGDAMMIAVFL